MASQIGIKNAAGEWIHGPMDSSLWAAYEATHLNQIVGNAIEDGSPAFPNVGLDYPCTIDNINDVRGADNNSIGANEGWYWRVRDGGILSKIGLEVTTAAGNISVAAYRNSGTGRLSVPGTRLATSGTVSCPTAGVSEISLGRTISLNPGDWLALSCDTASAFFRSILNGSLLSAMGSGRVYVQSAAHPLPALPSSLNPAVGKSIALYGVE